MPKKRIRLSNNPPVVVELERDSADFIVRNCETNMRMGMEALQAFMGVGAERETLEKFIGLIEAFKKVKVAVENAIAKDDKLRVIIDE